MNPWIPALANFILPGLGYFLLRKKLIFGWLLIVGCALWFIWGVLEPSVHLQTWGSGAIPRNFMLGLAATLIVNFAFAYDAYQLAKGK